MPTQNKEHEQQIRLTIVRDLLQIHQSVDDALMKQAKQLCDFVITGQSSSNQ